jgi:hypothetical protein
MQFCEICLRGKLVTSKTGYVAIASRLGFRVTSLFVEM